MMNMIDKESAQSFQIEIEGQEMHVLYRPYRFGDYGHFEFTSPHEPRRRIILSETGYRSQFAPMWQIEEAPDAMTYAEALARSILKERGFAQQQEPIQPSLF